MQLTSFQNPEIRDSSDNIIQAGAYGKNSALVNAQNTGILDYINNNLMALQNNKINTTDANNKFLLKSTPITIGNSIFSALPTIYKTTDDSYTEIRGATNYLNGAYLRLDGKDGAKGGQARLIACDGTNTKALICYPNGDLKWDNKNVERVNASSNNYIRYENGLQICWAGVQNTNNVSDGITTATFSQPFSTVPQMSLVAVQDTVIPIHFQIKSKNNTEFTFVAFSNNVLTRNGVWVGYVAIGKWK